MARTRKAKEAWHVSEWDSIDKDVDFFGPEGFYGQIDFDDVDHPAVEAVGNRMIAVLNKHWGDPDIPQATWKEEDDGEGE